MVEEREANAKELEAITAAAPTSWAATCSGPAAAPGTTQWRGWWGEDPPYHAAVFVLTNHPREPLTMQGGTTFTFVTDGIESAMAQARTRRVTGTSRSPAAPPRSGSTSRPG